MTADGGVRTVRGVRAAAAVAGALVAVLAASGPVAQERSPLVVTYLANEGFLLRAGGSGVLIDALFRDGVGGYAVLTPATRKRLEAAAPPFDEVAVVAATHRHADHFDATAVAAYLSANPEARFISTPQAVALLADTPGFDGVRPRVEAVLPDEGDRERRAHRGIGIELLNIHHGRSVPIENLGVLVEIGGYRALHIGDSNATAADLRAAGVPDARLDVLFVPYWSLMNEDGRRAARESAARHLVLMHVPVGDIDAGIRRLGGFDRVFAGIRGEFPNAVWLRGELDAVELR